MSLAIKPSVHTGALVPETHTMCKCGLETAFAGCCLVQLVMIFQKQHAIAVLGAVRGEQASTSDMKAYGTSKLMTIMSNSEIVRRLKGSGVDSFICQPGMSSTPVYKKTDKSHVMANVLDAAQTVMGQTEERGAVPLLYAATAPEMAGKPLTMSCCASPCLRVHTVYGEYMTPHMHHL